MTHIRWNYFSKSKRFFFSSVGTSHKFGDFLQVSDEVQETVTSKKAVVALESTIITHGMPYPHNLSTALSVERKVRENGAVPATVAIMNGKICVGLSVTDLSWLAEKNKALIKVSRRDLPFVLSHGLSGGTTVSATMIAAHMTGISVFATGGIGGVHRGAEYSFDVSADLTELGRTPVAVVSSGVKSILDIAKTLEYLETQGVCVVTFGEKKNFPAFFTRDSGFCAPYSTATFLEAAKMIDIQLRTGLNSGILLAVPIPDEFTAAGDVIQKAINEAVELARKNNIVGKEVTPYILNMVSQLTKGESLVANIALIENNASVAGGIACCLAKIQAGVPAENITCSLQTHSLSQQSSPTQKNAQSSSVFSFKDVNVGSRTSSEKSDSNLPGRPVVIGATVVDFSVQIGDPKVQFNGATYKGSVSQSFGGVGRNLADCLSRLGSNPVFVSATGVDKLSNSVLQYCSHMDMHSVQTLGNVPTATYCPVLLSNGNLLFGVGNMDINSQFTLNEVSDLDFLIKSAPMVLLDANFTPKVIETIVLKCADMSVPVWFEPTDLFKSIKPFETDAWKYLSFISPNLGELVFMYRALMGKLGQSQSEFDVPDEHAKLEDIIQASVQMCLSLVTYIPVVLLTLGRHGVLLCHRFGDASHLLPLPAARHFNKEEGFKATYFRALPLNGELSQIVSVSGAGDCFASAFIAGMLQGSNLDLCIKHGFLAASLSLQSTSAVPETITTKAVLAADAYYVPSNWQPIDVSTGHSDLL